LLRNPSGSTAPHTFILYPLSFILYSLFFILYSPLQKSIDSDFFTDN